jgi:LysR family transcriptional regulator, nitrogen assimilation regulatory protein
VELLELRYFLEVANSGSFSRASVRLGVTQPALSRQIQKLESELRTELLYRHGRGVTLTAAGRKLSDAVKPILQELVDVKDEIIEERNRTSGAVVFGVPPSIGSTLAAPLARRFRETYPEATLWVREAFSSTLLEWVESGRLDLAVLYDARRSRNLIVAPLLMEHLFLIELPDRRSTKRKPIGLAELAALTLVLPGPENGLRRVIDKAIANAGLELRVAMQLDSVAALKQLVEAGAGCTILPFGAVHGEVRERRLAARPIASDEMRAVLVTATPLHRPVTKATRALLRLVHAEVQHCIEAGMLEGEANAWAMPSAPPASGDAETA